MAESTEKVKCFACGALVPDIEGPTHKYMLSAPGCWKLYGEILAKEYAAENYDADSHRTTVDTYAVTHPGKANEWKAIQSINIHLIRLYYSFEINIKGDRLLKIIKNAAEDKELHKKFIWLSPPSFEGTLHITDVLNVEGITQHKNVVRLWGESVWSVWKDAHGNAIQSLAAEIK